MDRLLGNSSTLFGVSKMNIFVLDKEPINIPKHYCDVHLRKMILEYTQLLCTAVQTIKDERLDHLYKPTHINHPCSIWVRSSSGNYGWLWELLFYCHQEYEQRFKKIHKSKRLLHPLGNYIWDCKFPKKDLMPWPQVMPKKFKIPLWDVPGYFPWTINIDNTIEAYRNYYAYKLKEFRKRGICKFTR